MVILPKIQFNLFSFSPPWGNFNCWLFIKLEEIFSVSARSSMLQGGRVETAVVPIISSATNIRDYYVRQIALMKWGSAILFIFIKNNLYINYFFLIKLLTTPKCHKPACLATAQLSVHLRREIPWLYFNEQKYYSVSIVVKTTKMNLSMKLLNRI